MTRQASSKKAKIGEDGHNEDKISNLPDVILSHILSFVSTRDAVRTSTLSRRWNSVWPTVPTLNMNESEIYKRGNANIRANCQSSIANFLDEVFLDRKMPYIETVTIQGRSRYDASRVKSWIVAAVDCNLREVDLEVDVDFRLENFRITIDELPRALFASNKLVVLKLHVNMLLNIPANCVCFPNLKVLELRKLIYKDDDTARNLISSCPVLEDLDITRSDHLGTLHVNSRSLKNLKVSCSKRYGHYVKKLLIDAPALEAIDIFDCVTDEYEVVSDLSSMTKAKLHVANIFSVSRNSERFEMCLVNLLKKIPDVTFLSFSSYTMVSLLHSKSFDLPKFQYLTCFELYARTKVKHISWELMMEILDCSPVLESIVFLGFKFSWEAKSKTCDRDVPKCLVTSLKTIRIKGLSLFSDLRLLTYFLENAQVLEKVIIDNGSRNIERSKLEVARKLSMVPKASMACQFLFC